MTRIFELRHALKMMQLIGAGVVLAVAASKTTGQTGGNSAQESAVLLPAATFEVVSIHPEKPGPDGRVMMQIGFMPNGTFTARGVTLKRLISMAYGVDEMQVTGGPDWLNQDRFSMEARADGATQEALPKLSGPEQKVVGQRMMQALMADRFKLTIRQETKEVPILALVVAKSGLKMQEAKAGDTYANGLKDRDGHGHAGMMRFTGGSVTAQGVPLDNLASLLTEQLHQMVQNKTGLSGKYDFTLQWTPEDHDASFGPGPNAGSGNAPAADAAGASIYTALQEQLGLKLESQKGTVPAYAIDHAERPTEN